MNILIIGPQASGKGTQAGYLSKKLNIPHLSAGEMLRNEKKSGSALGNKIAKLIDEGILVPDEIIWELVKKHLNEHPEGWILDGYPRTSGQTTFLDEEYTIDHVIFLDVPDKVCIERIAGRRICPEGHDYHIKYKPPKQPDVCDIDALPLAQRPDDNEEAVKKRLAQYHEKTAPVLEHYKEQVLTINGNQGIQEVWQEIQQQLGL